ncbi:MAG: IS21 family transposase [Desulfobulbus sp.]|nr:IS21 family transposase [Desulfobulbus sp.]
MTSYREILRLNSQGLSQRSIAASCGCGKGTVQRIITHAMEQGLVWPLPPEVTDERLRQLFSAPEKPEGMSYTEPDYEHVHREMGKRGVTLSLLWSEYRTQCREVGDIPFMYSAFCEHYRTYTVRNKATMHLEHRPGEQMEVDWAGQTMAVVDNITGDAITAHVFVAVLPCSGYAYVEAFLSRNQENWIAAHVNAYQYFGGVTRILVPDNLKTGVDRVDWYTPVINKSYHEMAEHYGTAVIPARVRKPKDKPTVEGTVGVVSTWIIAALRNWKFFSLVELNEAIREKLVEFNSKPFQKKQGSRLSVFLEEEQPELQPLPDHPFELAEWKICVVAFNYHVRVDKMFYSVPYAYIKHEVSARLTHGTVEIFHDGTRIASHARRYGHPGQYSTLQEHMPEDHLKYVQWNAERFLAWAKAVGENTVAVTKSILTSRKIEQQAYRTCMTLLKLAEKYSPARLEAACKRALSYSPAPGLKSVQTILATEQDKLPEEDTSRDASADFAFTRGSGYYGGDDHVE